MGNNKKQKNLQMKFSLIALVATAQAIKIRQGPPQGGPPQGPPQGGPPQGMPSLEDMVDGLFKQCDANDDKKISWKEATACGAPAAFKPEFEAAAGDDGEVDKAELIAAFK